MCYLFIYYKVSFNFFFREAKHARPVPLRPRLQLRLRRGGIFRVKRTAVGAQVALQQAERVPAVSGVLNLPEMAKGEGKVTVRQPSWSLCRSGHGLRSHYN